MFIKSKYKIAKRLGAPVFEKTQTQKYAISLARKKSKEGSRPKAQTDFGKQLLEKQKARYTYRVNERQFKKYVKNILDKKGTKQDEKLFETLESRLDNVVYRLGLSPTRLASRQMVSHGHIMVNNVRVTIPSYSVSLGDKVTIRPNSLTKPLFSTLESRLKDITVPSWLKFNMEKKEAEVQGSPKLAGAQLLFDLPSILEFYKR